MEFMEKLLTVSEVADVLRLNQFTVYRMSERRQLPSIKIGSTLRFSRVDLEAWLKRIRKAKRGR